MTRPASTWKCVRATARATPSGLVANKNDTFAYASSSTMLNLAAKDAPVLSVATLDATGTDACLCWPDAGIKEIKDLEGKTVMTTAAAGVNTFFPVALKKRRRGPGQGGTGQRGRSRPGAQLSAEKSPLHPGRAG